MRNDTRVRQVAFPLLAALIWGTAFVAQDICADVIEPMTFNALRSAVAVVVLLVIIRLFRRFGRRETSQRTAAQQKAARRQLLLGGVCCGTMLCIASNLQQFGISAGVDAGKAGFLTALYIVLVPVLGLFLKKPASLPVWIGVALATLALYLLCVKESLSVGLNDLLILGCALCFAVHILLIDHFTATVDSIELSCAQFLVTGIWSAAGMALFERPSWSGIVACLVPLLYVGVFSSGVAYTLQILSIKGANPTVVTILLSTESVFAVISGAIILHQRMTVREYVGCALMLAAVLLAQIPFPLRKTETVRK